MVVTDSPQRPTEAASERSLGFAVAICFCAVTGVALLIGAFERAARNAPLNPGERINPNTAAPSSLIRLPGIGWSKAQAIVLYRQQHRAATGDPLAFHGPGDLMRVPGFGPKTAAAISAWLVFEESGMEPQSPPETAID